MSLLTHLVFAVMVMLAVTAGLWGRQQQVE
jgi:hypothetical protein